MINPEVLKDAWQEVFPNSTGYARMIMGSMCFTGRLSKDATECTNNIIDNDALHFVAWIEENGDYSEQVTSLTLKPNRPYMAFSSQNLRKKQMIDIDKTKLVNRFKQVKEFVAKHRTEWAHDLDSKII